MDILINKIRHSILYERLRRWYERYERYLIPGALLFGIITDFLMFQYINIPLAFSILSGHVILSGSTIAFMNLYDEGFIRSVGRFLKYLRLFSPLILQYSFGALLSGFFVFYWSSGSFSASWPFILIIMFLMVSNDLLKKYYLRTTVQISVYFFIIFSWAVLVLPYLLSSISAAIFVLGGALSVFLIYFYLRLLVPRVPKLAKKKKLIAVIIAVIFGGMNYMYFANVIPPIPLSMREAGVYHFVGWENSGYRVLAEHQPFFRKVFSGWRIHLAGSGRVYAFSSIFAPSRLETEIVHRWQYYDENTKKWITTDRLGYPIRGGRDEGYRGYSFKSNVFPGRWRVDMETERGQVVGRLNFRITQTNEVPELRVEWY